ncbi:MAG: ribosome maturation factor RimP [Acidimicrobiales bacterium]
MTTTVEELVRRALGEGTTASGLEVYDIEVKPGLVRVLIERPGGVDVATLTEANRIISAALDAADPIPQHYTLEVSSPGLERPLRTPAHFAGQVGAPVSVKTRPKVPGERRLVGTLLGADEAGITVDTGNGGSRQLAYADVERARTVFEWGPNYSKGPKPQMRSAAKS